MSKKYVLFLLMFSKSVFAVTWSSPIFVSPSTPVGDSPQVGIDGTGKAISVWKSATTGSQGIYGATLDLNGIAWNATNSPEVDAGSAYDPPQLAVNSNGKALAGWSKLSTTNYFARASFFNGSSWGSASNVITPLPNASFNSLRLPGIALDNKASPSGFAMVRRLTPAGMGAQVEIVGCGYQLSSWLFTNVFAGPAAQPYNDALVRMSSNSKLASIWSQTFPTQAFAETYPGSEIMFYNHTIALSSTVYDVAVYSGGTTDGNALAVLLSGGILYSSAYDASNSPPAGTWSSLLLSIGSTGFVTEPHIAVFDSNKGVAVWMEDGNVVKAALFNGTSWDSPQTLDSGTFLQSPRVAADDFGNVVAVWLSDNGSANVVRAAVRFASTSTWEPFDSISTQESQTPQVAIGGPQKAVVVWWDKGSARVMSADTFVIPPSPPPPPPPPPPSPSTFLTEFSGRTMKNEFLTQIEYGQLLSWAKSSNPAVAEYRIVLENCVVASVPASGSNQICLHNQPKGLHPCYVLVAVDANGKVLDTLKITWF